MQSTDPIDEYEDVDDGWWEEADETPFALESFEDPDYCPRDVVAIPASNDSTSL